jgi:hypothetical protein
MTCNGEALNHLGNELGTASLPDRGEQVVDDGGDQVAFENP